MESQAKFVSMRFKLTGLVGGFLFAMAMILTLVFNIQLASTTETNAEKHVEDLVRMMIVSLEAAPDIGSTQKVVESFSDISGALHATLRDARGNLISVWPKSGSHLEAVVTADVTTRTDDGISVTRNLRIFGTDKAVITVGLTTAGIDTESSDALMVFIFISLFLVAGFLFVCSGITRYLVAPITQLVEQSGELIASGDLTSFVGVETDDEVGQLAHNFRQVVEGQRGALIVIRRSTDSLIQVMAKLSEAGMSVSSSAVTIQSLVRDTSSSIENMLSSLRGVGINVDGLQDSSERGAAFIVQMANSNDEIASNMQTMATAVHQSTQAIDRMATSVQETSRNISDLEASIADTSGSMTELGKAISQVESNAQDTVHLSSQGSSAAAIGAEALRATLNGIDKISNASQTTFDVITNLNETTGEIGNIIGVIKGVADQTNLLALNASIIASQAGEHGKGFGVVADEIKNLAERTRISTTEIAGLIDKIQQESLHAIEAMERGIENVQQGVKLGRQADEAFEKINDSSDSSNKMVQEIALSTQKQAQQTKLITSAIQRVSLNAKQITRTSDEQANSSREIRDGTRRMNALTEQVHQSSTEQAQGSVQVIRAIEEINGMVGQVSNAQQMQTRSAEDVLQAVQLIDEVCADQDASVRELDQAIMSLQTQAEELAIEIQRFKL